jgi:hypothetical protein
LAGIGDSLDRYCSSYEKIAKKICNGIDEGFNEGLREGIKQGFVEGVKECRLAGFDNIEVEIMEETLKCAFKNASDETVCSKVKQVTTTRCLAKISLSFKQEMEEACNNVVEEIKNADFELDTKSAFCAKNCVDTSIEKIKGCIGDVCGDVIKKFPADRIQGTFFDHLQEMFNNELDRNLKACEDRICKEIDYKVNTEKADHERH